jgi:hypothetical protein
MPHKMEHFCLCYKYWLGIRDDCRTLIGVEDSKIVKKYDDENEEDIDV